MPQETEVTFRAERKYFYNQTYFTYYFRQVEIVNFDIQYVKWLDNEEISYVQKRNASPNRGT